MHADQVDFTVPMLRVVPALFTRPECMTVLGDVRETDWLPATVNGAAGREINERLRNSQTAIVRDATPCANLWGRIEPHVPRKMSAVHDGRRRAVEAVGLFEPLRIYRYEVGEHFGLHHDQSYTKGDTQSLLTLMVYLDDDFSGGETDFPEQHQTIVPRTGDALWFQHAVLHAGNRVTRGVKHVLRSDVMYRAVTPERT